MPESHHFQNPRRIRRPIQRSKTTGDIAAGAAGGATIGSALVALLRALVDPDAQIIPPTLDAPLAAGLTALLPPFLSRLKAWTRRNA